MEFNIRWNMPYSVIIVLLCCNSLASASSECSPYPISARIGNVTLANSQIARGIAISVGQPEQQFAFLPQWPLNGSFVYGTDGKCLERVSTQRACATLRGGEYEMLSSKTRKQPIPGASPGNEAGYPNVETVADAIKLNTNITIDRFPLGIPLSYWGEQFYHPMMAIGLGQNSSLLNTLKSTGRIASRSWSMFWGQDGGTSNTQLDGSIVFGGYDKAKVSSDSFSGDLIYHPMCSTGMMVQITDMILNLRNGTDLSLFPDTKPTSLTACVVPDFPVLLSLPFDPYFENFQVLTNTTIVDRSFGINFFSMRYDPDDKPYDGDLTFKLNGISVRIFNHQLVVPDRSIDVSTGELLANSTGPNLILNSLQSTNANDTPVLGRQFLTSAYVHANYDTGKFQLWKANPTSDEELVGVNQQGEEVADNFCSTKSDQPTATEDQPRPLPSTPSSRPKGMSSGTLGGIVVAVVAAVAIALLSASYFTKRRKASAAAAVAETTHYHPPPHEDLPTLTSKATHTNVHYSAELYGSPPHGQMGELPAGSGRLEGQQYELAG